VWPNGVSLASEAAPNVSRPWLSGLFGTAANFGLILLAVIAYFKPIQVDNWRWVMLVAASPALLGILILAFVPESPGWLAKRARGPSGEARKSVVAELFRPPLLKSTILGILLGTIPQVGNWGATNWLVPWANQVQEELGRTGMSAATQWTKSSGAALGSLLGGWFATLCGRRTAYFLVSLASLSTGFYLFHNLTPADDSFLMWVFIQGFFGTIYFGWLPLYLPELFPTRVRATGTGMAFNWGRVATAGGVLMSGQLMPAFGGDYSRVGQVACFVYALGMIIICFAPDTSKTRLEE
jgi:MFS transporter, SHS family, sialic acid transporter